MPVRDARVARPRVCRQRRGQRQTPPTHTRERPRHALSARAAATGHSKIFCSPARHLPTPSELRSA
eukprot:349601-Chlamydomonas_euryale.AAC.10